MPPTWEHVAPEAPGTRVAAPVHGVDLPLTALAVAGVDAPAHMKGWPVLGDDVEWRQYTWGRRDRMDERYDMQRTARDERYLYIRNYMPHRPYGQHNNFMWQLASYQEWEQLHLDGELDEQHDRFWGEKPAEELYDLERDPDAVENLIDSDREQVVKMRRRMRRALAELDDDHDVIRFWAAQGLLMLGDDAEPAIPTLEQSLQQDPSVYVRIPAAEALARLGRPDDAVAFLAETVDTDPDDRIKLQALNALTWVGDDAATQLEVIDRAATSDDEYVANAARYLSTVLRGTYSPAGPV